MQRYLIEHNLDLRRVLYWKNKATERFQATPKTFKEFTSKHENLVNEGNDILLDKKAIGFNILPNQIDMDIAKDEPLIFYNNYIRRTEHFALLLAEMEKLGIVTEEQIGFGNKASAVFFTEWSIDKEDEHLEPIHHKTRGINGTTDQTVETVITFRPTSDDNAAKILTFLERKTDGNKPDAIPQSWETPDIRATKFLKPLLEDRGMATKYKVVRTNIKVQDGIQLIVMQPENEQGFDESWKTSPTLQNTKLIEYLEIRR